MQGNYPLPTQIIEFDTERSIINIYKDYRENKLRAISNVCAHIYKVTKNNPY